MLRATVSLLLFASALTAATAQTALVFDPPPSVKPNGKHVVLLSGDEEYRSEEGLPMLAKILSQRHGFKTTVLFALDADGTINPENQRSLPGFEALDSADAIVMLLRFRQWPDDAMDRFVAAYHRGVPLIALRTSTHPFNYPATSPWAKFSYNSKVDGWTGGFGKQVLGETWVTHWGRHKIEATRGVIEPSAKNDPLVRGITEVFGNTDVYEAHPPTDAKIILRGVVLKGMTPADAPADYPKKRATDKQDQGVNSPAMPVAWTRVHTNETGRQNKIFTTTMGAATDLENEGLRRLIVNSVYWGVGLEVPASADVRLVDPYTPFMYAFKGHRLRLKPDDYALGKTVRDGDPRHLLLLPGQRIAIIGNALADRMQHHGWLETMIHTKHPSHQIVLRNLAFPGDEIVTRARSKDFGTPDEWLTKVRADTVFAFFGYNESFAGSEGRPKFREDLAAWIREERAKNYNGRSALRLVLFSPIATEKHPDPNFEYRPEINANLSAYTQAMAEVARAEGVMFIDLFAPSQELFAAAAKTGRPLTINGVHLNDEGDQRLAEKIFGALFGEAVPPMEAAQKLRAAVNAKNAMWHSRYRTMDGYNIYGDRSKIAYVSHPDAPKITNTHVMMEEMAQRDVMSANLDRRMWAVASDRQGPVEMLPLPVVTAFGTNKPGPNIDSTYEFIDGEEAIKLMTLAPGLKANLFASEKQFPELAKAVQMNWDTKGRLWVSVWPNYPNRTPTSREGDKIIILEDTDKDGRADKSTIYLDDLNCPTGFQFFKDGVLLVQAPDLWFVRDTDGDGKADWKERVLMGLDSADSHHTANSLIYEPGGAILLSDGVFHRTQVESVTGPVRNIDGAIHRFEPLTAKFEVYASYDFANPHGRAFDYWGNDIITDATGNNTYWGPAFSGKLDYPLKHPKLKQLWERPSRPSAGSSILTSAHFPPEYWGDYLNPNVIGFQGIYRVKLSDDGSGLKGTRQPDLISSTDRNFRPIDTSTGPDGALYVIDWHNPLIGHLQSHLRDSNRDHVHGRIYRITAEGRPLVWQPKIDGEPIPALLELLKRKENHLRNLAKVELGRHESGKVIAAAKTWAAALDQNDPDYPHHLLEALWVHQWHNRVDADLLTRVLNSPNAEARAAGTRVLCYWRDRIPTALRDLQRLASDNHPRVRLHAVRAASFFSTAAATQVALTASKLEVDYYLDYVIGETLRQLRPHWRKQIGEGTELTTKADPSSVRYLLRTLSATELLKLPRNPAVAENILARPGIPDAIRAEALATLVKSRGTRAIDLLLETIDSPAEVDIAGVGRLLVAQPVAELKANRAALSKLAMNDQAPGRSYAWAAIALGDGSLETIWGEGSASPLSLQSLVGGIALIPDAKLRATAHESVMKILAADITELHGPDSIVAATQRDAIRAAVSTRREPAAVFEALTKMIERGYQVPTAAQGIRGLPRENWSAASAGSAARALVAWAGNADASERTSRDYVETIQVVDELAGTLPSGEAESLRKALRSLRVSVFVVRAVPEGMRYDVPRLVVQTGRAFEIIFENPDVMPHNLVVVHPNTREKVGLAAMALSVDHRDDRGRAFVPSSDDIIAATKMLETGGSESLRIPAQSTEGVYEYVCTFPGHWVMMYGQLIVTKDVDAYLQANPAASPSKTPEAPASAGHSH